MPSWPAHRVAGVDAARGVALLGMVAVHVVPPLRPDGSVSTAFLIAAGRSSALFALLAGVGLALLAGGPTRRIGQDLTRVRLAVLVRAALLVLIGLLLGPLESGVAVILVYYGLLFAVAVPFLALGPRALTGLAVGVAVVVPVLSHLLRRLLPPASLAVPTTDFFDRPWLGSVSELTLTGYYPVLPWLAYLLAGMAVGSLRLRDPRVAARLLVGGLLLAVGARAVSELLLGPLGGLDVLRGLRPELFGLPLDTALTVGLFGTTPADSWWWLAVAAPHTATPLDLATTTGSSLAVLGLLLLVLQRPHVWAEPLVAVGGMPLTLYTLHVVLLAGPLPRALPGAYLWHVLVVVAVAVPWRRLVGQGPLELLTQRVSWGVSSLLVPRTPDAAAS
jgi:uncharacterized membrane protein YeiB